MRGRTHLKRTLVLVASIAIAVLALAACRQPLGSSGKPLDLGRGAFVNGLLRPGKPLWADFRVDEYAVYTFSVQPPLPEVHIAVQARRPIERGFERFGDPIRGVAHLGPHPMQAAAEHRDVLLAPGLYSLRVNATVDDATEVWIDISDAEAPAMDDFEPQVLYFVADSKRARARIHGRALRTDCTMRIGDRETPLRVLRDGSEAIFEFELSDLGDESERNVPLTFLTPWSAIAFDEPALLRRMPEPERIEILGLKFRALPAGAAELGPSSEGIALRVEMDPDVEANEGNVRSYLQAPDTWISEVEVTQDVWNELGLLQPSPKLGDRLPVHAITYTQALACCREFAERAASADPRWRAYEFDLPTEDEWEYAARAGTRTPIAVPIDPGDETPFSSRLALHAWFVESSRGHSAGIGPFEVGTKAPNAFGLRDMHGNVFEWCHPSAALPAPPTDKGVLRGGCYATSYRGCRVSNRDFEELDSSNRRIGMRLIARKRAAPISDGQG